MSLNLSTEGMYLYRFVGMSSSSKRVVLEFELPGTGEVIWAQGEVCHEAVDTYFHGSGIRFTTIAEAHRRLIRDYLVAQQTLPDADPTARA
mgnify:CR=1 FL=1